MWSKVWKGLKWVGGAVAAIAVVLLGLFLVDRARSGRDRELAKKHEAITEEKASAMDRADEHQFQAKAHERRAERRMKELDEKLDEVGKKHDSIADIGRRLNERRRKRLRSGASDSGAE